MNRIFLSALLLGSSVVAAHAAAWTNSDFDTTFYYETSYQTPAATGTVYSHNGQPQVGGLCTPTGTVADPGNGVCPDNALVDGSPGLTGGTSSATGVISFTTPTSGLDGGQFWHMTISVGTTNTNTNTGDIYELTLNGVSQGVTSVVLANPNPPPLLAGSCLGTSTLSQACPFTAQSEIAAQSSGAFTVDAAPGTDYTVEITDLLAEYVNGTDNLPGLLGYPAYDGGNVGTGYGHMVLQLTVDLTPAPEPASLALLGGAATLLGALRHRRIS